MTLKIRDVRLEASALSWEKLPDTRLPEVAIAGRSNVGKSTLLNRLIGRKALAPMSGVPGRTRALKFYRVNDDFFLVDLPGFGYAKVPKTLRARWKGFIALYVKKRPQLKLVMHLVDSRHDPMESDIEMFELIINADKPCLIILTKADKISKNARTSRVYQIENLFREAGYEVPVVVAGKGVETEGEILKWIEDIALEKN